VGVADMPLLEVESIRAGSTCCKTCSKGRVAHGNGGVFLLPASAEALFSNTPLVFMARFYDQLVAALAENQPFTLALISGVKGSSPQRVGAKALFFQDGRIVGTLGGGCLEAEVHARAQKALKSGQPATFEMLLDHDFGWDDGLICGGSVSGLILPQARQSAELWRKLATVTEPVRWGVKKDFSVTPVEIGDEGEWLYQETVSPLHAPRSL